MTEEQKNWLIFVDGANNFTHGTSMDAPTTFPAGSCVQGTYLKEKGLHEHYESYIYRDGD